MPGESMKHTASLAIGLVLLMPALAGAVPRPREPRLHPRDVPAVPSFVHRVQPAIVGVKARAPEDAPSSIRLGVHRFASGVVFDERGYVVTVSYAVLDAVRIEVITHDNVTVPGELVGLDFDTGLAIVRIAAPGPWPTAALGDSRDVRVGDVTGTVGVDEDNDPVTVSGALQDIRRFAASWEYMLDRALFVAPGSPSWGGSAVVDAWGRVIGIASLRLGDEPYVNLAIPMESFVPIKDELIAVGRVMSRRPRPWLGLYTVTTEDGIVVNGFAARGPAQGAGFQKGDRIVRVNDVAVASQEQFYTELWRGQAGDVVRVAVRRGDGEHVIAVRSADRRSPATPLR
jgi:S1-C subfamily serine protease